VDRKLIVIMGGGISEVGGLPLHVIDRCKYVINLLKEMKKKVTLLASSSFSLNIPPKLNKKGFIISEATSIKNFLESKGVKEEILCEQLSHDTLGSILFSLLLYARPRRCGEVIFVTSDFHLERVKLLTEIMVKFFFKGQLKCTFVGVKSKNINQNDLSERELHEHTSVQKIKDMYLKINNENEFINFILTNHKNYNYEFSGRENSKNELY
jgi:hypothetical protein